MNLQDGVSLSEAFTVTLFSMGVVFLTLFIIYLILNAFKLIFYKEKTTQDKLTSIRGFDDELIAVIAAAIEAHSEESTVAIIAGALAAHNESSNKKSKIRKIKRIS